MLGLEVTQARSFSYLPIPQIPFVLWVATGSHSTTLLPPMRGKILLTRDRMA